MIKNKSPEILAPAGSMESLNAAIRCGADAIYLGGKAFSARQNATNFNEYELEEGCEIAHKSGVKIYQTLNTLVFDEQFSSLKENIKYSEELGVDAFIVQDLGLAEIVRQTVPDMPLHASTQMTIHTKNGALLAKELGFSRVVVAREMSAAQLEEIADLGIEIETFVHGALCMSVSGQCYMSAMIGSRSANRGLCAQACRLPFSAVCGEKRCDLSLKDMSHIPHILEMADMGISSLKIEGRMKRPEYVAAAVTACRAALDGKEPDLDNLRAVFSRSGFTDGYFTDNLGEEMFGTRQRDDVVSASDVFPELQELYRKERKVTSVSFDIDIKKDIATTLTATDSEGNTVTVTGEVPQLAKTRPSHLEQAEKQLSKLGGTIYDFEKVTGIIEDGLMLPASGFNELRRLACEGLDVKRIEKNTHRKSYTEIDFSFKNTSKNNSKKIRLELLYASQLDGLDLAEIEYVTIPLDEARNLFDFDKKDKIILSLPRYTKSENSVITILKTAIENGFDKIECQNVAHIKIGQDLNLKMFGGFGLNVTNSLSVKSLSEMGLTDCTVSFEMKLSQISRLTDFIPLGVIAYGRLPLMLTVNCPIKQAVGCGECENKLTDRTSRTFPVECSVDSVEILNSDVLYMADRLSEIEGASFITLKFHNEKTAEIKEVIKKYMTNAPAPLNDFTRGLYYRGII